MRESVTAMLSAAVRGTVVAPSSMESVPADWTVNVPVAPDQAPAFTWTTPPEVFRSSRSVSVPVKAVSAPVVQPDGLPAAGVGDRDRVGAEGGVQAAGT